MIVYRCPGCGKEAPPAAVRPPAVSVVYVEIKCDACKRDELEAQANDRKAP